MKRYGHLYERIYSMENLKLAHKNAKKGKGWYEEVKLVDADEEYYLTLLQDLLINKTYRTSEYVTFTKTDGKKPRDIHKLPYFPDRICQWAILQVIEPFLIKQFTADTYSAIPERGIHQAFYKLKHAVQNDVQECQYCLKFDIKKYYPSIDHIILKSQFRRLFKDDNLLWVLDEIIDSTDGEKGIPIGNYISQYAGNFYLSGFDHWMKEVKRIKYYFRYMDDIVIFAKTKAELHTLRREIAGYLWEHLKLTVKEDWQIFPTYIRGVDFVGYRVFLNYVLLRKSTCKQFKAKMLEIGKKVTAGKEITFSEWCSINSYKGWLLHCDSYRLSEKYITPIQQAANQFYLERVKRK
jgi:hypothetical protein